ncbi:MAG TPA: hypothetical protein DCF33_21895 [Saprospirales bacterium]|nr:hypothetical protein [Saprospirales bacterium]
MKSKKIIFLLLLTVVSISIHQLKAQVKCPTSVGYRDYTCQQVGGGFFFYNTNATHNVLTSATLNFDSNDPNCNATINLNGFSCSLGNFRGDNVPPYCEDPSPTGTVVFNTGLVCVYDEGELVPCNDLVTACKDDLIAFAQGFISPPTDCKLWEGPCATESEIWRTGDVNIGSIISLEGYKLGVNGGITTEMLQICKAEWCDYVFSDTFNLMPLKDVEAYIEEHNRLPNTTSATEIALNGGFLLADETIRQQEKIEEIFLHLISLNERLSRTQKSMGIHLLNESTYENYKSENNINEQFSTNVENLLQIECFQVKPAPAGIGGIKVSPDLGPYKVSWSGPSSGNIPFMPCAEGAIQIPNLIAGLYVVTVSNVSGNIGTCSFTITQNNSNTCAALNSPSCRQAILNVLQEEAFSTPSDCEQWEGDQCSKTDPIFRLGNVGIGTSVGRSGFSLAVKGGIVTDRLRVELCESQGWCDYVFREGYPLTPLNEIKSFVTEHKHLPGTISQAEVISNDGIELKSVKLDQQEKIEEAYLHLIALNKRKELLKSEINALHLNQN